MQPSNNDESINTAPPSNYFKPSLSLKNKPMILATIPQMTERIRLVRNGKIIKFKIKLQSKIKFCNNPHIKCMEVCLLQFYSSIV